MKEGLSLLRAETHQSGMDLHLSSQGVSDALTYVALIFPGCMGLSFLLESTSIKASLVDPKWHYLDEWFWRNFLMQISV